VIESARASLKPSNLQSIIVAGDNRGGEPFVVRLLRSFHYAMNRAGQTRAGPLLGLPGRQTG